MDKALEVLEREKNKQQIGGGIYQRREANNLALDFPFLGPPLGNFFGFLFSSLDGNINSFINRRMVHVTVKTRGSSWYKCRHLSRRMFSLILEDALTGAEIAENGSSGVTSLGEVFLFFFVIVARTAAIGLYRLIDDI